MYLRKQDLETANQDIRDFIKHRYQKKDKLLNTKWHIKIIMKNDKSINLDLSFFLINRTRDAFF
jgi:hypothetical protein